MFWIKVQSSLYKGSMSDTFLFRAASQLRTTVKALKANMKRVLLASCFAALWLGAGFPFLLAGLSTLSVYLLTGGWRFARVFFLTIKRDAHMLFVILSLKYEIRGFRKLQYGVPSIFHDHCVRNRNKTCFIDAIGDRHWTYGEVDEYSNQVANYFASQGLKPGDAVGVFMESSAEFVCVWLGLAKIGGVPALLNFNLRGHSLAHCIEAAKAVSVVFSADFADEVDEALKFLNHQPTTYYVGNNVSGSHVGTSLDAARRSVSSAKLPTYKYDFNSPLLYIYTSGTTGLPKAAKVVHSRYYYMAGMLHKVCHLGTDSVIYDTLPLYHSAGGILGVGQALLFGSTVVIRKKFSASNFWSDCVKYRCTATQYIGEICRYLLAQPTRPEDKHHNVQVIYGNGLRPQIWTEFKNRYNIDRVVEFYGATEGNAAVINSDNTVGCVGFLSLIAPAFYPTCVIKVDKVTGEPLRGPDGFCMKTEPGEPGELIGKIVNSDPIKRFDGYSTKAATEKKIARDVFSKGDMYFLTGDILTMDDLGYIYFKDRTGDTFRWKGENVSTAEVEAVVSNLVDKRDAAAYGVEIPGVEGRAGMVAIEDSDPTKEVDLASMYQGLTRELPAYARPVFVRLLHEVDKTGTYKLMKVELRNQGYDPSKVNDKLFYFEPKAGKYLSITPTVYADIMNGKIRF